VAKAKLTESSSERRVKEDRRNANDRRKENMAVAVERRVSVRRKVPRRRQIDPTTCERDYSPEEIEFMHAMDAYKRTSGRMFPTCSEILEVLRGLGYTRVTAGEAAQHDEASLATDSTATMDGDMIPAE
jgi:hypothetical protein